VGDSAVQVSARPVREYASVSAVSDAVPRSGDCALSEKLRPLNLKKRALEIVGWGLLVPAGMILFFSRFSESESELLLGLAIVGGVVGGICIYMSRQYLKKKKELISEHVIKGMLADNFELIEYSPHEAVSEEQLRESQLRGWNTRRGNDRFQAKYKGVSFAFSDVTLIQSSGRSSGTRFKGQWLIFDLPQAFPVPLLISEMEHKGKFSRQDRAQMEQRKEGAFTVLPGDTELVSRVLTPAFQAFLAETSKQFFYNERHLFFTSKQAHIGINTRQDLFEPCNNVQDIPALRERIQGEIDYIKNVVDGFLLTGLFARETAEADDGEEEQAQ